MNLILIGYRATGKSTLANRLGKVLGHAVWHLDDLIVERAKKSIPEIVEEEGWDAFRNRESQVVADASRATRTVVDCGGGVILRKKNVEALKETGRLVYLACDPEILAKRIGGDANRPSLTGDRSAADEVIEVLNERRPLYEAAADLMIDTGTMNIENCLTTVLEWYGDAYGLDR